MKRKAVFLDRDGCINKWVGFLKSVNEMELLDGAAEAIRLLKEHGWFCIVVTNQPLVESGVISDADLERIHDKMRILLKEEGAILDAVYYCPHDPKHTKCDCHKPNPGLVFKAAAEFDIDLEASWFVGDSWRDVQTGINARCRTVLLTGTGGEKSRNPRVVEPTRKYARLIDFAKDMGRLYPCSTEQNRHFAPLSVKLQVEIMNS